MRPQERTPLLQVVHVAPARPRYRNDWLRRFCTIALCSILFTFAISVIFFLIIFGEAGFFDGPGHRHPHWRHRPKWDDPRKDAYLQSSLPHGDWPEPRGLPMQELKDIMLNTPDAETARGWSHYYTAGPHLPGKNESQAIWTKDLWKSFGVDSEIASYDVYLNYPKDHGLSLLENGKVNFEASLEEDVLKEDPTTGLPDRTPTFHAYSASGNVTARYVYVNFGTYKDFQDLLDAGVDLNGKIALVKYGAIFRGLKVQRAQELGMVGCIIYSDPQEDGETTEANGYKPYPEGPARNPSSVQRGSVQYLSTAPGDPSTIGYPSKPGAPRGDVSTSTPQIPSIPISYADALPLLKALNGHGPSAEDLGPRWLGGLQYKGVKYNIGPSPKSTELHLYNEQEYSITPIWNTIGIINGTIEDEVLLVGNHRDAWIAGGAADPNSGSAVLNEVVRSFGAALAKGWKPQRTIVFASWDGEEYGLLGSTEWVEEYIPWLSKAAFAYLNVDTAVSGPDFHAVGAPLLDNVLFEATKLIPSPNQTISGQSVYDLWSKRVGNIGSGSDYTAFQDFAGIPSIDMGFGGAPKGRAVYHYHSNYDSAAWMDKYVDPTFKYHEAMAKILALMSVDLLEAPLYNFNATNYGIKLEAYLDSVPMVFEDLVTAQSLDLKQMEDNLRPLRKAIDKLQRRSMTFDAEARFLATRLSECSSPEELSNLYRKINHVNNLYKQLERAYLYDKGLDGRNWFKHVVFAPGIWTGYAGATWPGLVERAQAGDMQGFRRWVVIGTAAVDRARQILDEYVS